MSYLLVALDALAGQVAPPVKEVPDARLPLVLPTTAHVVAEKAVFPRALAAGFADVISRELVPLIRDAKAAGLLDLARNLGPYTGTELPSDVTARKGTRVVKPNVDSWERRLRFTPSAAALVAAVEAATGDPLAIVALAEGMVGAADAGARAAALRDAMDVLTRWVAAHQASSTFGGSKKVLALVLALYRTEGDLAVPRSQHSLASLVPAHTETALQSSLAGRGGFLSQFGFNSLILPANRPQTEAELAKEAVDLWLLHIGGHDLFVSSPTQLVNSALKWTTALFGSPMTARKLRDRIKDLRGDMVVMRANTVSGRLVQVPPSTAGLESWDLRVTPKDPLKLVRFALELAYVQFDSLAKVLPTIKGADPTLRWQEDVTYMLYNNQVQRSSSGEAMPHLGLLGSAAGAIASSPKYVEPPAGPLLAKFRELQTSLRSSGVSGTLIDPRKWPAAKVESTNGAFLTSWLTSTSDNAKRAELLSFFAANAGVGQWRSYQEHRANTSRFRLLRHYYTDVLP